jgi:hypothetical protein
MRRTIAIAMLLSFCTCAFAAQRSIKQPPPATGILISVFFGFSIVGDGINTTFDVTPSRIPPNYSSGFASVPQLPLVGVLGGGGSCTNGITFTGTVSGRQLIVNFPAPPPGDKSQSCTVTLLFQPQ